jgi:hypothetical protein
MSDVAAAMDVRRSNAMSITSVQNETNRAANEIEKTQFDEVEEEEEEENAT